MNPTFEKYIQNLKESKRLNKPDYPAGLSREEVIRAIQANTAAQAKLKQENDSLLFDAACGITLSPDQLTPQLALELQEFSSHLSKYMMHLDNPLCYHLHTILLEYARLSDNLDDMIRESYYCGLTLYYLNRTSKNYHINRYAEDILRYFSFAGDYLDRIEEFKSSETRSFILRSYCNIKLAYDNDVSGETGNEFYPGRPGDFKKRVEHSKQEIALFSNPAFRALVPDFNWDNALYALHMGMTVQLTYLRHHNDPEIAELVYESAQYIYLHESAGAHMVNQVVKPRIQYTYQVARFHMGYLPIQDLLDFFYSRVSCAKPDAFTPDGAFDNLQCAIYYLAYCDLYASWDLEEDPHYTELCDHIKDYMWNFPVNEYLSNVIFQFSTAIPLYQKNATLEEYLLSLLITFHQSTFVHSQVVGWLTRELMQELIQEQPEIFLDFGVISDIGELAEKANDLLTRAYEAGLYHDVGKISVIDHVSQYARRLLDVEFELIKEHCYCGYHTLSLFPQTERYALNALGHHRYFDESGGYPECFHRTQDLTQLITDLLSVADSIDAATDHIGHPYSRSITFSQLLAEFRDQSGTRYAPYVVRLFDNSAFHEQLSAGLVSKRMDVYYAAYELAQNRTKKVTP